MTDYYWVYYVYIAKKDYQMTCIYRDTLCVMVMGSSHSTIMSKDRLLHVNSGGLLHDNGGAILQLGSSYWKTITWTL
jgi:hypothetical protein